MNKKEILRFKQEALEIAAMGNDWAELREKHNEYFHSKHEEIIELINTDKEAKQINDLLIKVGQRLNKVSIEEQVLIEDDTEAESINDIKK